MKTKKQILKYAFMCRFSDEDWERVTAYCKGLDGAGRLYKGARTISGETYDGFLRWIENGHEFGEVVRYGRTLGMIGADTPEKIYFSAYLSLDGRAIVRNFSIKREKVNAASEEDRVKFNAALSAAGFEFSDNFLRIVERKKFVAGDFVHISDGETQSLGIMRSNSPDEMFLFCRITDGKFERDCSFSTAALNIREATPDENMKLFEVLAKNKLEWSASGLCLRKIKKGRVKRGARYWHLSERFEVVGAYDAYNRVCNGHFKSGNYFTSCEEAVLFREKLEEIRKSLEAE